MPEDNPHWFRRLSWPRLLEHHLNALIFVALCATGLAQKFHDSDWAATLIGALGGIDQTRLVHRYCGIAMTVILVQHLLVAVYLVLVRRVRPAMLINLKDFGDVVRNIRYYLGGSSQPARCDRFDYKQKFEYWGVIMGGVLMAVTGLMLWAPTTVLRWFSFLPGQVIPAAKVAHSNEAMMAFLIIVTWHIYNSIFSPEVFPLDTVVVHGRISAKRMMHEHPLEYERLCGAASRPKSP